jgi:putative molybdopterin biosynthesis protein
VLDRDEAERRFRAVLDLAPRGIERVDLESALGRVLAADVQSPVDVPSFDRSNVDGYAVVA